jgi:hypothetical protein
VRYRSVACERAGQDRQNTVISYYPLGRKKAQKCKLSKNVDCNFDEFVSRSPKCTWVKRRPGIPLLNSTCRPLSGGCREVASTRDLRARGRQLVAARDAHPTFPVHLRVACAPRVAARRRPREFSERYAAPSGRPLGLPQASFRRRSAARGAGRDVSRTCGKQRQRISMRAAQQNRRRRDAKHQELTNVSRVSPTASPLNAPHKRQN